MKIHRIYYQLKEDLNVHNIGLIYTMRMNMPPFVKVKVVVS